MRANELRIGNWVNDDGDIEQVNKDHFYEDDYVDNLKGVEPIPLTEEWLVKFGFDNHLKKRIGDTDLYLQVDSKDSLTEHGVYLSTDIGDGLTTDPKTYIDGYFFIHQLQNLYHALTGEELTIK
jgi:hypothetical protein